MNDGVGRLEFADAIGIGGEIIEDADVSDAKLLRDLRGVHTPSQVSRFGSAVFYRTGDARNRRPGCGAFRR